MEIVHKKVNKKARKLCSVPKCSSYFTENISLFNFPKDEKLRKTWQKVLKIHKPISNYMRVCSNHFRIYDINQETTERRRLKKGAIPSLKIPCKPVVKKANKGNSKVSKSPNSANIPAISISSTESTSLKNNLNKRRKRLPTVLSQNYVLNIAGSRVSSSNFDHEENVEKVNKVKNTKTRYSNRMKKIREFRRSNHKPREKCLNSKMKPKDTKSRLLDDQSNCDGLYPDPQYQSLGIQTEPVSTIKLGVSDNASFQACLGEIMEFIRMQILDYNLKAFGNSFKIKECSLLFQKEGEVFDQNDKDANTVVVQPTRLLSSNQPLLEAVAMSIDLHKFQQKNEKTSSTSYRRILSGKIEIIEKMPAISVDEAWENPMKEIGEINKSPIAEIVISDDENENKFETEDTINPIARECIITPVLPRITSVISIGELLKGSTSPKSRVKQNAAKLKAELAPLLQSKSVITRSTRRRSTMKKDSVLCTTDKKKTPIDGNTKIQNILGTTKIPRVVLRKLPDDLFKNGRMVKLGSWRSFLINAKRKVTSTPIRKKVKLQTFNHSPRLMSVPALCSKKCNPTEVSPFENEKNSCVSIEEEKIISFNMPQAPEVAGPLLVQKTTTSTREHTAPILQSPMTYTKNIDQKSDSTPQTSNMELQEKQLVKPASAVVEESDGVANAIVIPVLNDSKQLTSIDTPQSGSFASSTKPETNKVGIPKSPSKCDSCENKPKTLNIELQKKHLVKPASTVVQQSDGVANAMVIPVLDDSTQFTSIDTPQSGSFASPTKPETKKEAIPKSPTKCDSCENKPQTLNIKLQEDHLVKPASMVVEHPEGVANAIVKSLPGDSTQLTSTVAPSMQPETNKKCDSSENLDNLTEDNNMMDQVDLVEEDEAVTNQKVLSTLSDEKSNPTEVFLSENGKKNTSISIKEVEDISLNMPQAAIVAGCQLVQKTTTSINEGTAPIVHAPKAYSKKIDQKLDSTVQNSNIDLLEKSPVKPASTSVEQSDGVADAVVKSFSGDSIQLKSVTPQCRSLVLSMKKSSPTAVSLSGNKKKYTCVSIMKVTNISVNKPQTGSTNEGTACVYAPKTYSKKNVQKLDRTLQTSNVKKLEKYLVKPGSTIVEPSDGLANAIGKSGNSAQLKSTNRLQNRSVGLFDQKSNPIEVSLSGNEKKNTCVLIKEVKNISKNMQQDPLIDRCLLVQTTTTSTNGSTAPIVHAPKTYSKKINQKLNNTPKSSNIEVLEQYLVKPASTIVKDSDDVVNAVVKSFPADYTQLKSIDTPQRRSVGLFEQKSNPTKVSESGNEKKNSCVSIKEVKNISVNMPQASGVDGCLLVQKTTTSTNESTARIVRAPKTYSKKTNQELNSTLQTSNIELLEKYLVKPSSTILEQSDGIANTILKSFPDNYTQLQSTDTPQSRSVGLLNEKNNPTEVFESGSEKENTCVTIKEVKNISLSMPQSPGVADCQLVQKTTTSTNEDTASKTYSKKIDQKLNSTPQTSNIELLEKYLVKPSSRIVEHSDGVANAIVIPVLGDSVQLTSIDTPQSASIAPSMKNETNKIEIPDLHIKCNSSENLDDLTEDSNIMDQVDWLEEDKPVTNQKVLLTPSPELLALNNKVGSTSEAVLSCPPCQKDSKDELDVINDCVTTSCHDSKEIDPKLTIKYIRRKEFYSLGASKCKKKIGGDSFLTCNACSRIFLKKAHLRMHLITHKECRLRNKKYTNDPNKLATSEKLEGRSKNCRSWELKTFNYECRMCHRRFSNEEILKIHLVKIHPSVSNHMLNARTRCVWCGDIFEVEHYRKLHWRVCPVKNKQEEEEGVEENEELEIKGTSTQALKLNERKKITEMNKESVELLTEQMMETDKLMENINTTENTEVPEEIPKMTAIRSEILTKDIRDDLEAQLSRLFEEDNSRNSSLSEYEQEELLTEDFEVPHEKISRTNSEEIKTIDIETENVFSEENLVSQGISQISDKKILMRVDECTNDVIFEEMEDFEYFFMDDTL